MTQATLVCDALLDYGSSMAMGRVIRVMQGAGAMALLAALLFRALIPAGFMATFDRSGAIEIVMCSGSAQHQAVVFTPHHEDQQKPSASDECPFAMTSVAPLQQAPALAAARVVYAYEYAYVAALRAPPTAAYAPQAPPTGPPLQA